MSTISVNINRTLYLPRRAYVIGTRQNAVLRDCEPYSVAAYVIVSTIHLLAPQSHYSGHKNSTYYSISKILFVLVDSKDYFSLVITKQGQVMLRPIDDLFYIFVHRGTCRHAIKIESDSESPYPN